MEYTKIEYMDMYETLSFCRSYYLVFEEYALKGVLPGFHHLGLGQEGLMLGLAAEIGEEDWFTSTGRNHPILAKTFGVKEYLCELFCRRTGFAGGMSGEAHWVMAEKKRGPMSGLLGATPSMGAGIALGYKLDKKDGCVVISHGDGTLNEGMISEALNIVAAWKLPVVWVVENNGIAVSTTPKQANAIGDLSERGRGFGLPTSSYDGTDVLLVREVMREAMAKARNNEPSMIEFRTTRWLGHFVGDPDLCRDENVVLDARANRDPLIWYRNHLIAKKIAVAEDLDAIDKATDKEIRDAIEYAMSQPVKTKEDVFRPVNTEQY